MLKPAAEFVVDEPIVRALLTAQHPDLADRSVRFLDEGWDNTLWRVGDDLLARLPRREAAAGPMLAEQRWLPLLAPRLPLPVPRPVRLGTPDLGYPWAWSVVPHLAGVPAITGAPIDGRRVAGSLGRFLGALHAEAPADAPTSTFRGTPVLARLDTFEHHLTALAGVVDVAGVRRAWDAAVGAPQLEGPKRWVHGDLHPGNLLVADGDVVGVIDFSDLNGGDPATDLAGVHMLLEPDDVRVALDAYGETSAGLLERARGWAVLFGLLFTSIGLEGREDFLAVGRATLRRVLSDVD